MARVTFTINCAPDLYRDMERFYGKGNISPSIISLVYNDICGRKLEQEGLMPVMREIIKLGVEANSKERNKLDDWELRGKLEDKFGRVFPDEVWKECAGIA